MEKKIKIVLAILLFLCLADMPYGYYELVRFIAFVGFGLLAFRANQDKAQTELVIYGALALLFQPFFKVSLGRELWNVIDVIVGIGLIITIFKKPKNKVY
ncbi:DUF6804 family protein [Algoriphagus limi]|uniref:SPW repeat-containing protein n=1 Tax=Algoriphagus limi TaxID=2975273 RepID=A0ABT2G0W7_9BACT|nr:DUF6804 family protein [Algoriphagus limi]MCS5488912.1 hypothetical protein [Algoriphagus limi]